MMPMLRARQDLAMQPEFLAWEDIVAGQLEAVEDRSMPPIALNIVTPPGGHRLVRIAL
jgi:hypothetical protein